MAGRREKTPSSCVIPGRGQFVVWVIGSGFHCCFLQPKSWRKHEGKYCLHVPRNLSQSVQMSVRLYFALYRGVMVMLTGRGLSFMRSLQLPAVGLHAHENHRTQTYAHTAGLPLSDDLGWVLEAVHVFSTTHPHLLLNPEYLASYYSLSSFLCLQNLSSSFIFHFHHIIIA